MDALILAGGRGTRLRSMVRDRAKPVAQVLGHPFLAFVLRHLESEAAIDRVILCVGHRAASVERALGARFGRLALLYSREERPLGTAGALGQALSSHAVRPPAIALNGDTYFPVALDRLIAFHRAQRPAASAALARVADSGRYGAVRLAGDLITAFEEKGAAGSGWINGGVYVLGARAIARIAEGAVSLEREVLPALAAAGALAGFRSRARFLDIGVPSDYMRAATVLRSTRAVPR